MEGRGINRICIDRLRQVCDRLCTVLTERRVKTSLNMATTSMSSRNHGLEKCLLPTGASSNAYVVRVNIAFLVLKRHEIIVKRTYICINSMMSLESRCKWEKSN